MSVAFPIDIPSGPGFTKIKWSPASAVSEQESPFTFQTKVYAWSGQIRVVDVELPPMELANAKAWSTFGYRLNGTEGTFYLRDSVGKGTRGRAVGTGLVRGAGQTGQDLITDGWIPNVSGLLLQGDWVQIGTRLYTVLDDVDSDASGIATLSLWPKIRVAPADNLEIPYGPNARGLFRLTKFPDYEFDVTRLMVGFSFQAKEVVE